MSIYAISDLHLSLNTDKPMSVFGSQWVNYTHRMQEKWNAVVKDEDLVIIPGDISWATYLEDAVADFAYIHGLNGQKIILKGNHDYWWTTLNKMEQFIQHHGFDSIRFIKNTAILWENTAICGTRGWVIADEYASMEDQKIYAREKQRLLLSLEDAKRKRAHHVIVAMHYPPIEKGGENHEFLELMQQYGVTMCVFGHLHAAAHKAAPLGMYDGIFLQLVACDYLDFTPLLIQLGHK